MFTQVSVQEANPLHFQRKACRTIYWQHYDLICMHNSASDWNLGNLFTLNKLKMANAGPMVTKSVSRFDISSVLDSFKQSLYGLNADDIRFFG